MQVVNTSGVCQKTYDELLTSLKVHFHTFSQCDGAPEVFVKSYDTGICWGVEAAERTAILRDIKLGYELLDEARKAFVSPGSESEHIDFEIFSYLRRQCRRLDEDAMILERGSKRILFSDDGEITDHLQRTVRRVYDRANESFFFTIPRRLTNTQDIPDILANFRICLSEVRRLQCIDQLTFPEATPFCRHLLTESAVSTQTEISSSVYLLMESAKTPLARASKRTGAPAAKVIKELLVCIYNSGPEVTVGLSRLGSNIGATIENEPTLVRTQALQYSKEFADMDAALPTIKLYGSRPSNECEAMVSELSKPHPESWRDMPEPAGQMHACRKSRARGKKQSYTKWKRPQRSRALENDGDSIDGSDVSMAYNKNSSEDSDYMDHGNASNASGTFRHHSPSSGTSGSSITQHSLGTSHLSSAEFGRDGVTGYNKNLETVKQSELYGLGSSEEGVQVIGRPRQKRISRVKVIPCPITGCPGKECDISGLMYAQSPSNPARGYYSALIGVVQTQTTECRTQNIHLSELLAPVL